MVRGACAGGAAGRARDRRGVSRGRGRQGARGQHPAPAPRGVALSAPTRGLPAADRLAVGVGDLCRHPPRASAAIAQKDRTGRRTIARRTQGDPRHLAGVARPRLAPGRLCRRITTLGIGAARYRGADPPRGRHRPVSAVAQKRPGGAWHNCVAAGGADRSLSGDGARDLARRGRRSARVRCSGGCGGCRHRASAREPGESR